MLRKAQVVDHLLITVCVGATKPSSLPNLVRAIRRQQWQEWELVILGQGPRESELRGAVSRAADGDGRIRYQHLSQSGLSRARNHSLEVADGAVLAFTDDDCEPQDDWLSTLAAAFGADPALGVVGGAVVCPVERLGPLATCPVLTPTEALYDPARNRQDPPLGWDWIGANFAIRREVAKTIGRFDECLGAGADFPAGEDTDYKLRLEKAGVRMLSTPRSVVLHAAGVRRGLAQVLRSQSNYSTGNGALAAKLTLMDDPRGELWLQDTLSTGRIRGHLRNPTRIGVDLRRARIFAAAYECCKSRFRVEGGLLRLR
ncbi:MAG: glycosyltransferase family 2 protein [Candidatus Dormibacteraceae bacterium]